VFWRRAGDRAPGRAGCGPAAEVTVDRLELTTDRGRIDTHVVHRFLTESYWAAGITVETVERSMEGSMCFGLLLDGATIGFARVVTDAATFAYLADVFILPEHRGTGLGKRLVEGVLSDPRLSGLRRWVLRTGDAHDLYRRYGFEVTPTPEVWMERAGRADGEAGAHAR